MGALLKSLFCDDGNGSLSHRKIWTNIGFTAMTYVFVRQAVITADLLLAYGAVITCNSAALFWLKNRYQSQQGDIYNGGNSDMGIGSARNISPGP